MGMAEVAEMVKKMAAVRIRNLQAISKEEDSNGLVQYNRPFYTVPDLISDLLPLFESRVFGGQSQLFGLNRSLLASEDNNSDLG